MNDNDNDICTNCLHERRYHAYGLLQCNHVHVLWMSRPREEEMTMTGNWNALPHEIHCKCTDFKKALLPLPAGFKLYIDRDIPDNIALWTEDIPFYHGDSPIRER